MLRAFAALVAALSILTPAAQALAAPAVAFTAVGVERFETSVRDALHSGEWSRVRPFFLAGNDPALVFLAERWGDMRAGRLDPVAWEVTFDPYFGDAFSQTGQLSLAARRSDGSRVGHRFDVSLVRRGAAWLVGDAVRYDKVETRLTQHALSLDLREAGELRAEDAITLAPTGPDRHVYLRLHPAFKVEAVSFGAQALDFVQRREVLHFERPAGAEPSVVNIRYAGRLPVSDWDFVRETGSVLRSEFLWYPRQAVGSAFTQYQVTVGVAPGQQAIAVGEPQGVEKTPGLWLYRFGTRRAVEGMSVYAGTYDRFDGQAGPVEISAYLAGGRQAVAPKLLSEVASVLDFYGEHFGRYPYPKMDLVETDFPGGYGATSAVALPRAAFDRPALSDEFLAHEIAHNWTDLIAYKGTLGERGFMAEGVASYLDLLYHAGRDGASGFRRRLQEAQRRYMALSGSARDVALAEAGQEHRATWQALTYDKASLVLHMLRRQVGDKAFDQGLRDLYAEHSGRDVGVDEFRSSFERASKQHLGYFFEQWLNRPGVPNFVTEELSVKPAADGQFELSGVLVQRQLPYVLNVPLVVLSSAGETLYQVPVKSFRTPFRLRVPARPRLLLIDPLRDALLQADGPIALP